MDEHIYPNEPRLPRSTRASDKRWEPVPIIEELKPKARAAGPVEPVPAALASARREGLSNLEYAPLCEIMGRVSWSPEVFNCSAPDTGNMETIERYGTRGAEEAVARAAAARRDPLGLPDDRARRSPPPTPPTSRCSIKREGDDYVINGRKWWSSGAGDPRCKLYIVMGKTNPGPRLAPQPAVDDPGARRHAGRQDPAPR